MRRLTALIVVTGLMSLAVAAPASGTEHIKDKFSSISWGGSDGSLPWAGPWSEIEDDGDEKKGNVRVVSSGNCASGNCIRMSALTTLLGAIGVERTADTIEFAEASLRFSLRANPSLLGSQLQVQVNGGDGWVTVKDYQLGGGLTDNPTIDVSDYASENFRVRFLFTGLLLSSEAFVDNVEITGSLIEETTTTTTSTSSTTTTTLPTTTTTQAPTTTSTRPTTTTSPDDGPGTGGTTATSTSTTTTIGSTTSTVGVDGSEDGPVSAAAGSTTTTSTTTTTIAAAGAGTGPGGGGTIPDGSGIRAAARGIQADFQSDLYGDARTVASLSGIDFRADYNMAVEVIESSWGWIVLLGMVIAYAIVSGLDRRRRPLEA